MTALFVFLVIDLALLVLAALLLLRVLIRRGRATSDLALATVLIALAIGVWYAAIRTPIVLP